MIEPTEQEGLYAAADRIELIPPEGGRLGGFGCRFEAHAGSLDPLYARIALFRVGSEWAVWVSCDLLGFSTSLDREFREAISAAASIPTGQILVSCTHTHSAPVGMPARGPSGIADERWIQEGIFTCVAECVSHLRSRVQRVTHIRSGTAAVSGLGYNRQDEYCPIDERVISYSFIGEDGLALATIINYALHPVVIGETNHKCSADFPGRVCSRVEAELGGVALFINGSCGDVDPVIYRDQGRHAGTVETITQIGESIARAALRSLVVREVGEPIIAVRTERIAIPLDPAESRPDVVQLRDGFATQARANDVRTPAARGAMFQLEWAQELLRAIDHDAVPRSLDVELCCLQVGPMRVVTFPLEIYSEIGLEIRRRLAPRDVIIAAYTGGLIGYVVTSLAKRQGGYGAALSHRYFPELLTPIGLGADKQLADAAVALVNLNA